MKEAFLETLSYLEKKDPNLLELFNNTAITEVAIPETSIGIKKYVINLYRPIILSHQRMNFISFNLIRGFPNRFDQELLNPFLSYYDIEKECLHNFKKILCSNNDLSYHDLPKYSSCLMFINAIGYNHYENQKRFNKALNINSAINDGFNVYANNDSIKPVNTEFVKKLGTAFKKEIHKK